MPYYFYIARCSDKSLYIGYTNNLKQREQTHNSGNGSKYTKHRRPVKIIYFEIFENRIDTMKREKQVKRWRRDKKEALIKLY